MAIILPIIIPMFYQISLFCSEVTRSRFQQIYKEIFTFLEELHDQPINTQIRHHSWKTRARYLLSRNFQSSLTSIMFARCAVSNYPREWHDDTYI